LHLPDGTRWLIDCGRQAPDQLHAAGVRWHDITGQIITHVHGDHVYGLEDFAFSRFFFDVDGVPSIRSGGPRIVLVCHDAVREEVWQTLAPSLRYAPDQGSPANGTLETYFDSVLPSASVAPLGNPWDHAQTFVTGNLSVVMRETMHVPGKPSTSVEIALAPEGRRIAWWSGDSTVDAALLTVLEPRTSVFFHDCTFVDYPGQVHGAFAQLEQLPESVRTKMVLMHHEDDLERHRTRAEALGFRVALPGDSFDLVRGVKINH
jgi:ribonuclease BN (tRNA processing enzyme)